MNETKELSAAKLLSDLVNDPAVESRVKENIEKTRMIDFLVAVRCKRGLSQSEVAKRMNVSVSKVSRFEASCDADLKMGELASYVGAVGLKMSTLFTDDTLPIADRIKHCIFRVAEMLSHLTDLARSCNDDKDIVNGIHRFRSEVLFNFLIKFKQTGEDFPLFKFEESDADKPDAEAHEVDAVTSREHSFV